MGYPGGKGRTFQHIINLLPPHDVYVESHLGGGAVLKNKKAAVRSIGIDRNPSVIEGWQASAPELAEFRVGDAAIELQRLDLSPDAVVYCDPPYLPSTRRRKRVYAFDYDEDDHRELLSVLQELPCRVILSGYPSELYDSTLASWSRSEFRAKTHTGMRTEVLWFNYEPPSRLHDSRYLGQNFRQREVIRRRLVRLRGRLERLSRVEQEAAMDFLLTLREESECRPSAG